MALWLPPLFGSIFVLRKREYEVDLGGVEGDQNILYKKKT